MSCPCEDCISLAICVNSIEIYCVDLIDFLNKASKELMYPEYPEALDCLRTTLRGNWCVVGINNNVYKVQKDRKLSDGFPL